MYIHTYHNIHYSRTCTHLARTRNDLARTCHHFARICQDCARIAPFPRPLCTHARTHVRAPCHALFTVPHRSITASQLLSQEITLQVVGKDTSCSDNDDLLKYFERYNWDPEAVLHLSVDDISGCQQEVDVVIGCIVASEQLTTRWSSLTWWPRLVLNHSLLQVIVLKLYD